MLYVVCWARRAPRFHKGYTYCLLAGTLIVLFLDYKKKRYVGWTRPTNIPNRQAGRPFGSHHELKKIRPPARVGGGGGPCKPGARTSTIARVCGAAVAVVVVPPVNPAAYVDHRPVCACVVRRASAAMTRVGCRG